MDRQAVERWIERYEQAWRMAGTDQLASLFAPDATYVPSPWTEPATGLDQLAGFWESEREGPDEQFDMTGEIVAVDGNTAVVRVSVDYGEPSSSRWRDLWVIQFDPDGRCTRFEEWPFAPDQRNGHEPN